MREDGPEAAQSGVMVDVRCPNTPQRMFARLSVDGQILPGNVIEIACRDCRNEYRREQPGVRQVLHRYNLLGEHLMTVIK